MMQFLVTLLAASQIVAVSADNQDTGARYNNLEQLEESVSLPATCEILGKGGKPGQTITYDRAEIFKYISDKSLTEESCEKNDRAIDSYCGAKFWPPGLQWVQFFYSRTHLNGTLADSILDYQYTLTASNV